MYIACLIAASLKWFNIIPIHVLVHLSICSKEFSTLHLRIPSHKRRWVGSSTNKHPIVSCGGHLPSGKWSLRFYSLSPPSVSNSISIDSFCRHSCRLSRNTYNSGPRRYEWHTYDGEGTGAKSQQWSYTRAGSDRATLLHVLREEILSITEIDIHNPC